MKGAGWAAADADPACIAGICLKMQAVSCKMQAFAGAVSLAEAAEEAALAVP